MFTRGRTRVNAAVMVVVCVIFAWGFLSASYMTAITLGINGEVEGLSFLRTSWEYARSFDYFIFHFLTT